MILLLSSDGDYSTAQIVKWLRAREYRNFLRLNPMDFVEGGIEIDPAGGSFSLGGEPFSFDAVNVVWYRRFGGYASTPHSKHVTEAVDRTAAEQLKLELNNICDYFVSLIPPVPFIGSTRKGNTNKLRELRAARLAGLNVPYSRVCSDRESLQKLTASGKPLITKSVYNAQTIEYDGGCYTMFTSRLDAESIDRLPERFFPSLVQEEISKDYEVRVFYCCGKFYSMAILSQDNPQTSLDFRRYDSTKPNRNVPCQLDADTQEKITAFMEAMELNVGSLDFAVGLDGTLYFLEVNYMGQFGMVDNPCNYGIHRDIADMLIKMDRHEN